MHEFSEREHRAAAPTMPSAESLERVRTDALSRAVSAAPGPGLVRATFLVAAVSAMLLGVIAGASFLAPRPKPVFAHSMAMQSLALPAHGVLHTKTLYSTETSLPTGPLQQSTEIEKWHDIDRKLSRGETRVPGSGALVELAVRHPGQSVGIRSLSSMDPADFAFDGVSASESARARKSSSYALELVDGDVQPGSGDGEYADQSQLLRRVLGAGRAAVTGPVDYHGIPCWRLRTVHYMRSNSAFFGSSEASISITALMRVSDYGLESITEEGPNFTQTSTYRVREVLRRSSLPADFFSLDVPRHAVPPSAIVRTTRATAMAATATIDSPRFGNWSPSDSLVDTYYPQ